MNYKVLIADEAMADIFELVRYIHTELCNSDAAERLYRNLKREAESMGNFPLKFSDSGMKYRGYTIHKRVYESYLIFYIVSHEEQEVYVLRVIKDLMDWKKMLDRTRVYHFSSYDK
ncbi:MAG: type II toxin-antitoxin system RelE/ParE family toxin [Bacteroidales bacterium]|nr:type II toxin-antitoxin system RelE/ParE family toxin [Bacteroidales bacterium]MCM1415576.1 type II toxin-antitoxin system RelE/ParE family toxin [bacterium]MCM1424104.1 type II toxin-antitoxin system RelE/ParE family toxin [bacterium]